MGQFHRWTDFRNADASIKLKGSKTLDGQACTEVRVEIPDERLNEHSKNEHGNVDVCLEPNSGLITRVSYMATEGQSSGSKVKVEYRFFNYQNFGGLVIPTEIERYVQSAKAVVMKITSVQPNNGFTPQERLWVSDITAANPGWADVDLGELFIVGECTCGCRTVVFEEPSFVQNPRVQHQQTRIGEIDIHVRLEDGEDDYVSVLLHHSWGKLTYLEVIWYNFPEPVPSHWTELGREVRVSA